jgi:hypothetical protein
MTLTAVLLALILLVIVGAGIFLYRILIVIACLLEEINRKLPHSGLIAKLLSI